MARFSLIVDDEIDLVLRERWTDEPVFDLIVANLERLRRWEPWAQAEPSLETTTTNGRQQLQQWVDGVAVPTAIRANGRFVGTLGARVNAYLGTADIGYWLDEGAAGRGIVTRAASAMIEHLTGDLGLRRVEIHAAVDNVRSRAVAERLGFTLEGVLHGAMRVGDRVDDHAVYGRVFPHS